MEFVKEQLVFTGEDSPMANLVLSVMGAFAEFERALIKERQREGITLAQQRGAYRGRRKTLTPERAAELVRRAADGVPKSALARDYGISQKRCTNTCAKPSTDTLNSATPRSQILSELVPCAEVDKGAAAAHHRGQFS